MLNHLSKQQTEAFIKTLTTEQLQEIVTKCDSVPNCNRCALCNSSVHCYTLAKEEYERRVEQ